MNQVGEDLHYRRGILHDVISRVGCVAAALAARLCPTGLLMILAAGCSMCSGAVIPASLDAQIINTDVGQRCSVVDVQFSFCFQKVYFRILKCQSFPVCKS